ncbi:MAG TPA: glycoside hydrolase family 3 N-terminal domain-containing protein [Pyrinomonadaceae bacterium]|nr:glycoside hydrolase family 3 N-terminal domain-containing protein [Pyrinomonadaceae bacterium]
MSLNQILELSIEQKVGQLFFIGLPGPEFDEQTAKILSDISPGGVCLFARNIREAAQTRQLLDRIREMLPVEPLLSLDQEGGVVDRLRRILTPMPAANTIKTADQAAELAEIIAESTRILGFNMDFAPVVDVVNEKRSHYTNGLHSRAFGSSADDVTQLGGIFLTTLRTNGILGCLKHFPGLGASEVDSHEELPQVNIAADELNSVDLVPYEQLLQTGDVNAVMIAHAAYPQLDLQETAQNGTLLPSSLSRNVVSGLLRSELGYDGLVLTDDLEMGAILKNYGIGEACRLALGAGEDMLCICAGVDSIYEGFNAILDAVKAGDISTTRIDESLKRIAAIKFRISPPLTFDSTRLDALSSRIDALGDSSK